MMKRYVLIVAGGRGLRMGSDLPKQFIPMEGKPVLMHTLEAFHRWEQPYSELFTDDASVVEAWGHTVKTVPGNRENIKITTPFDLLVAKALLAK